MSFLLQRYRRHPTASRFILYLFFGWLFLFTLSSWIDLFQGFELFQVLSEWVQGLTFGLVILVLVGFPVWLFLTFLGEKRLAKYEENEEQSKDSDDMEWPDDL